MHNFLQKSIELQHLLCYNSCPAQATLAQLQHNN